jgi:glucose-6-phosphate isomerase
MENISVDFSNVIKNNIGDFGISEDDIHAMKPTVEKFIEEIKNERSKGEHGYLELPFQDLTKIFEMKRTLENFDTFVVVGIGGSSLGNIALHSALKSLYYNELPSEKRNGMKFYVLDNVDPEKLKSLFDVIDIKNTIFNIITKSGSTAETMSNFLYLRKRLMEETNDYKKHLIFTTDPKNGILRKLANEEEILSLEIPPNVGGRFSVFTNVGLLSALAENIDIRELLDGAKTMYERFFEGPFELNPAAINAVVHYLFYKKGVNISVMMPYSERLYCLADWYRQLWAESLGKKYDLSGSIINAGQTPIKALGVIDQHSQLQLYNEGPFDKIVTFLRVKDFSVNYEIPENKVQGSEYLGGHTFEELINTEQTATAIAMTSHNKPNITITFPEINENYVGQFMFMYELQTTVMGKFLNINPYDQPGVEAGINATYAFFKRDGYDKLREELEYKTKSQKKFII